MGEGGWGPMNARAIGWSRWEISRRAAPISAYSYQRTHAHMPGPAAPTLHTLPRGRIRVSKQGRLLYEVLTNFSRSSYSAFLEPVLGSA